MLINDRHEEFALFYDPKPVCAGDTVLLFQGAHVLLRGADQAGRLPLWAECANAFAGIEPRHAFMQGNRRVFIADVPADRKAPAGFAFEEVRVFRTMVPAQDAALLITAHHLSVWYARHRFCGACGGETHVAETERALVCGQCGLIVYPTILPAVIVAVTDGGRLLLARNARGVWKHYSLLAGFVEVGETAEQAVRREVLEEAGLRLKNIRYIASQPWGISQSLMLGFTAELDGPPTLTLQESEIAEARWFRPEEVPRNDSTVSIAFDLMERFRTGTLVPPDGV